MLRLARAVVILTTITFAGCGGDGTTVSPPPHPSNIVIASGNGQTGTVARPLSIPLAVLVVNSDGTPVFNVEVRWAVRTGEGRLSDSSVRTDSQGRSAVTWALGMSVGQQSVAATSAGLVGSPVEFTATATAPVVLHFDGTRWSTILEDTSSAHLGLHAIWGSSASDVYAVGGCLGGFVMLHYDGGRWTAPPSHWCSVFLAASSYWSVSGNSSSDVFVVGSGAFLSMESWIDHFDGQSWSPTYHCSQCFGLYGVWSRTAKDAIVVGSNGEIRHYDGAQWNAEMSATTEDLYAVWGTGTSGGVFAVGFSGVIVYYDGTAWRRQSSGTTQHLLGVWGTSPNDVFSVGGHGTILHYDGTAWTPQISGVTQQLRGVWGSSGASVFAVGDAGTILHYDGSRWTAQSANASIDLVGVWGSSATSVFAVGNPR